MTTFLAQNYAAFPTDNDRLVPAAGCGCVGLDRQIFP